MAGHAQLKFVMTECSKTQIRSTGLIFQVVGCVNTEVGLNVTVLWMPCLVDAGATSLLVSS